MKKILFILAVGLVLSAKADYIYWMVDTPANLRDFSANVDSVEWSRAILSLQNDNVTMSGLSYDSTSGSGYLGTLDYVDAVDFNAAGAYAYAPFADSSADYFLIELFDDSGKWMGSYSDSKSNLAQYIFGDNTMSVMPAAGFGHSATFAVPEPTSGLLFLVGGMLLGLKRRRQKV